MTEAQVALTTTVTTDFDDAVARARAALAGQGFGVLT
ncbi:MAG TPA: ABC transporter, partial [Mycolicibacterium fallax]|nr:ABC transporter [Mycolicibacterium fallax]